jgi:Virulence protein RhuM family
MSNGTQVDEPTGEVVVYEAPDGGARVEVVVGSDTVWLSQRQMADLLETSTDNVGLHIKNAYAEGELEEGATAEESSVVRSEGGRQVRRRVRRYNLDVIISVGYRVKSKRGTQFRTWANGVLRDHLLRGYTLNEKRLLARGVEFDQAVALLTSTLRNRQLVTTEGQAVLEVVQHVPRLPASEQRAPWVDRPAAILRHRPRCPGSARRRERILAQGPRNPPDPQPAGRGSPVVEDSVWHVLRPRDLAAPGAARRPRISS